MRSLVGIFRDFYMTQMNSDFLANGIQQYKQPKPEGDPDLVILVRDQLVASGLLKLVEMGYDNNRFIIEAKGKPSSVQRHLLNRYWGLQLMSSKKPTTEERYCLIPNGTVADWLKLFNTKVLPFIIENNLPVSI